MSDTCIHVSLKHAYHQERPTYMHTYTHTNTHVHCTYTWACTCLRTCIAHMINALCYIDVSGVQTYLYVYIHGVRASMHTYVRASMYTSHLNNARVGFDGPIFPGFCFARSVHESVHNRTTLQKLFANKHVQLLFINGGRNHPNNTRHVRSP